MKKGPAHKKAKTFSREHKSAPIGISSLLCCSGIGTAIAICSMLIIILLFCALCLCFDDPHKLISPLCVFAVLSSSFFGGFATQKKLKSKALLSGVLCGCMLSFALWILASLIGMWANVSLNSSYLLKILVIPSACLGSIVGMPSLKRRKNRQKGR